VLVIQEGVKPFFLLN